MEASERVEKIGITFFSTVSGMNIIRTLEEGAWDEKITSLMFDRSP